jgi:hypothetical protein
MQKIGGFFEKFNSKITREVHNLAFIMETIKKCTGISLEMKDIKISNGIIRLNISQLKKNEIFIKKERILKELEKGLISLTVRDIH